MAATMTATHSADAQKMGHVLTNGVNYYYEIHGRGEPLLLLHGGLGSIDLFAPGLPELAAAPGFACRAREPETRTATAISHSREQE